MENIRVSFHSDPIIFSFFAYSFRWLCKRRRYLHAVGMAIYSLKDQSSKNYFRIL